MVLARTIFGIIGNVLTFGLYFSPTFYCIYTEQEVRGFQPYPYLCTVLNGLCWLFYGLPVVSKDNMLVFTINPIGLVIELIYLTIFYIYASVQRRRRIVIVLLIEALFTAAMVAISMIFIKFQHRALFVGVISDIASIIMYASPLAIMRQVITTRSVEYMPFWFSVASFANGICWSIYALIKIDIFVLICNGLGALFGALFGAIQLLLYGYYYFFGTTGKHGPSEVQLSNQS